LTNDGTLALDYDAGLTRFCHSSGLTVSVYDNRPGQYFLDSGKPATEEQAELCGIDVHAQRKLKREREVKRRAAEAVKQLAELSKEAAQDALDEQSRAQAKRAAELRQKAAALTRQFLDAEAKRIATEDSKRMGQLEYELRHTGRGR
jgi:hypothetical protein